MLLSKLITTKRMGLKMKSIAIKIFIVLTLSCFFSDAQESNGNESFFAFINEFSNDEDFQLSRIIFPLEYVSWDLEKDTTITIYVKKTEWTYNELFSKNQDGYTVFYDNFECEFQDNDQRVLQWRGFTDMDIRFYFKRMNGKWFLIRYLNYDESF